MNYSPEQLAKRRERALAWNRAHPDEVNARARAYYADNRDRLRRAARIYAAKHADEGRARMKRFLAEKPWYSAWSTAKQRCENPRHPQFKRFGAIGVRFTLSQEDAAAIWARDKAGKMRQPGLALIAEHGHYLPGNCRFIEKHVPTVARKMAWAKKYGL